MTAESCRQLERAARRHARHVELEFVHDGSLTPDEEPPGWPSQDPAEVARRAGSVREVVRRPDGVGVLVLDSLDTGHLAAPYLEAAFRHLAGATGVVLDLRANGGGDPATVARVLDWLIGPTPTHLSDVVYRDRVRQWWTPGRPAAAALAPRTPVAALIGPGTYSSGEALAHHLQSQGIARLVGEGTPGAADHVTPVRVTPHVRAALPEAYVRDAVTGGNWEGVGVQPDVPCEAGQALELAAGLVTPGRRAR